MAQVALGVVGGVAGFLVGGPAGAAIGFSLGMALGAPEIPGPTLGEIAKQTAKEGDPRLIVWGIVRPVGPNLIAVQDPPAIYRVSQGGKGGSGPRAEVPFRTYALGVCEGPITGYRRIWRNNKLVYDGRNGSVWGAINNPVFMQKARFYYGDYSQLPDPDLEAVFGVGNVPAHRGTAYIVLVGEDLQDTGGAVPQWLFEVVRAQHEYQPESTSIVVGLADSSTSIRTVSPQTWEQTDSINTPMGSARSVSYTSDSSAIMSAIDGAAYLYSVNSGNLIDSKSIGGSSFAYEARRRPGLNVFAIATTAQLSGNGRAAVQMISLIDHEESYTMRDPESIAIQSSAADPLTAYSAEYSYDGQNLLIAHQQRTVAAGERYCCSVYGATVGYAMTERIPSEIGEYARVARWSPDGKTIYVGTVGNLSRRLRAVSYPGMEDQGLVPNYSSTINVMSVHPSGLLIALGFSNGRVLILSTATWITIYDESNPGVVSSIEFSPGGNYLIYSVNLASSGSIRAITTDDGWVTTRDIDVNAEFTDEILSLRWSPIQPVGL